MHPTSPPVSSSELLSFAVPAESAAAAGYITDPDEQPFSPSVFLDLPPTPTPPDDGQELDPAASSDDVVLPFISRILMADDDDDDDKLPYQCPDHQALLLAQQPFAEILSDTTATNNTNVATNTFSVSPFFFPNNAVSPVKLSIQLLSSNSRTRIVHDGHSLTTGDHGHASVGQLIRRHNNADKANMDSSPLFFGSSGQMTQISKETIEMLNQAFLKGMEEANKFLPTATNIVLPIHSETISSAGPSREHLSRNRDLRIAAGQAVEKVIVDGIMSSVLQESCSDSIAHKKHHNWDDLEVEMDRKMAGLSIAVIIPESDETGEKIDKFILIKYQSLLDKTMGMSIAVDMEAEKNAKKGKRKSMEAMSNEPAIDLRALLMQCAHAVATGNRLGATELLYKIKQHSSPSGDGTQRLAHCFAPALEARLHGTGSQLHNKSLMVKLTSVDEFPFLKAYQLCVSVSCFKMMAFMFSNLTILKAIAGSRRKKLHIVDYGEHYGLQWPTLLSNLAKWEEGPPEVRITCIVLPKSGYRPTARIEETGRRLSNFARRCGILFKFHSIVVAKWETVCADDLNIEPDEVLIVNGLADFGRLMDESIVHNIDSPSPRDMVLKNIQKMRPDVFILFIENSSYNTPFFLTRFREVLFYQSAIFDMMDAVAPRDNNDRILFEQNLLRRQAFNVIACEGFDRVERPETYKQWQVRNNRLGLRQLPLDPDIVKVVSEKICENYPREFDVDVDGQWFLQGWKGRLLYAISTRAADDSISSLG